VRDGQCSRTRQTSASNATKKYQESLFSGQIPYPIADEYGVVAPAKAVKHTCECSESTSQRMVEGPWQPLCEALVRL
jgi:hypothetical protein